MRSEMITVKDHLSIVADKDAEIRTLRAELKQAQGRCEGMREACKTLSSNLKKVQKRNKALRDGIRARRALAGEPIDEAALREAAGTAVEICRKYKSVGDPPLFHYSDARAAEEVLAAIRPLLTAPAAAMNEASAEGGE